MRVAAQEAIGGSPHDVVAARSSGSSSAGGFVALLAVLQNGGEAAAGATGADASTALDGDDAGSDESAGEGAADAALITSQGVVVTLSAATAAASAAVPTPTDGAVTPATAGPGGGGGTGNGTAATSGDVIARLASAASGGSGDGNAIGGAAATDAPEGAPPRGTSTTPDGQAANAAGAATPGKARAGQLAVSAGRAAGARSADGSASGAAPRDGGDQAAQAAPPTAATQPTPATASGAASAAAAAGGTGEADVARSIGQDARRGAPAVHAEPSRRVDDGDNAGDDGDAGDGTVVERFAAARPTSTQGTTRELPASARSLADSLQALGQAHGQRGADADPRPDAIGIARSDVTAASGASDGAARLRASGFTSGDAALPSWVERLASPDGLGAARRGGTLHLELEPDGLGRIEVRLSFGRAGVRAAVVTEHELTRTLLASQQPLLAAALERNDLRLESFMIDVGTQSGGDGREAWRDTTDPAAFDQIGLVHVSEPEPTSEAPALTPVAARSLVNVRA